MAATLDAHDYIADVTDQANKDYGKAADQYKWAQDQFAKNQGTSDKVVNRALDTGANFGNYATTDRGDYDTMTRPAMKQQMDFAKDYASPSRMAANRASAIGGSNLAFDTANKNAATTLTGYGIDPSAGRFAGLDAALQTKRAMGAAGAGTQSDRQTEALGQQYLNNAIKTGQVLPGQIANEANVGMAAGNQAVNAGLATTASGSATMGTPIQWTGLGDDMLKQWLAGMKAQSDVTLGQEKIDQGASSGTGAMIGGGLGALGGIAQMFGGSGMFGSGASGSSGTSVSPMSLGGSGSGGFDPGTFSGTGMTYRRGGMVRKFANGGSVKADDGEDMTGQYNTELSPEDEALYAKWAKEHGRENDSYDYDMRGAWRQGERGNAQGHFPDTYKKPNHPTFSNESRYDGAGGRQGGRWQYDETGHETLGPRGYAGGGAVKGDPLGMSPQERQYYEQHWAAIAPSFADGGSVNYDGDPDSGLGEGLNTAQGYAHKLSAADPTGYLGFGADALDLASDIAGHGTEHRPGDTLGITGPYDEDQGEQIGGAGGSLVGRAVGSFFGVPGAGAAVGRPVGEGVGAMVQGHFGEGLEDWGRGLLSAGEQPLSMMKGSGGGGGMPGIGGMGIPGLGKFFAQGGDVTPEVSDPGGNMVPTSASPSGGENTDDVHAMVSADEFVMPKDVSKWYGEKFLQNMIEKARREMVGATAKPEASAVPQAMAISPPSFRSEGARA